MVKALLYQEDAYVLLEPNCPERFVTPAEMLAYLEELIDRYPDNVPVGTADRGDRRAQAQDLLNTACEFETEPGLVVQWYVVRLEK
ncbi:chlororespiratory reduction protein 7 [Synechococcus elongatus]|uniref:Chlororespiratory reduction protein 7 n=2 Tax=Synechococcus elongatus TaxID=32046 RepID=Q31LS3_SYNE7|nr:chlororespiratory reduction protein 7 [Synechococcus elongatus]ABB57996.1 conserved hypothetical protein [Synechococcus elongatus PCC 7942 = FACHB-805]AJD57525.1 hypothetical protein M744_06590 [Synechococcus elongatus UTEX 2973]MBD2586714.1 chlororespiratory reduction protein 7 [Synechococcus elongatus FACHB-242]MBD2687787.1 chlororespiratory reduction protein 7 [Synechococcus elongatus FACHB-1061]MBD2706502.1 chlororespiratory reduction protein 7 [Synechococcus elongatus PCC 7942 = FACHB-